MGLSHHANRLGFRRQTDSHYHPQKYSVFNGEQIPFKKQVWRGKKGGLSQLKIRQKKTEEKEVSNSGTYR